MRHGRMVVVLAAAIMVALMGAAAPPGAGISGPRVGLQAYGDLFGLCFWHDGLHAGQSSSHDENDRNIDLMHFHGTYKRGKVLARITGPGVVYRIWSAGPTGTLKFYADGADQPVVACGFKEYLAGECAADQAFAVGRYANYTPVPFKQSLIVTAEKFKPEGAYYQITYMTYDQEPGIETVTAAGPAGDPDELAAAREFWGSAGHAPARDPGGTAMENSSLLLLHPGRPETITIDGAGMITELKVVDADDAMATLEEVRMRVFHDGSNEAAVDSPVDAFFGNRFDPRKNGRDGAYELIAVSATAQGYSSRWPMPFAQGMKLTFENTGGGDRRIRVSAGRRAFDMLPQNAMRFHALYRENDYPDELTKDKVYGLNYQVDQSTNYVVLDRGGMGYYVGCFLFVRSLGTLWWGEGDEMIWVDGGDQALIRGTGTEDEFNWSFGFEENRYPVSGALLCPHLKMRAAQTTLGYNVLYRFRPGDLVPFRERIKVTYERLGNTTGWVDRYPGSLANVSHSRGDDYRSVAFWYERP
ncbi:MAG TPA: glycoside hydrolase family 172 protein [bacterium]|nr:glycoside hydrolase family 172 protein [bacterium]